MKEIWIVFGSTGEYSDFREWWVCACLTEQRAKEICDELNEWCRIKGFADGRNYDSDEKPELDPDFRADYSGTGYNYGKCEIK